MQNGRNSSLQQAHLRKKQPALTLGIHKAHCCQVIDLGARIRKHPSFRAYYDDKGKEPKDDSLDCTRLVGRSAWNTKWLLIISAANMNSDREAALAAFIAGVDSDRDGDLDFAGVSDIKIGFKTYSTSGD